MIDDDDDDAGGGGGGDGDGDGDGDDVEHVCWQPFFGRNPSQELLGKSKWMHKILDLSLLFQDIGAAVGALYSLTICNESFHETCI